MTRFTHGAMMAPKEKKTLNGKTTEIPGISKGHISYNGETILRSENRDYDLLVERLKFVESALNGYSGEFK